MAIRLEAVMFVQIDGEIRYFNRLFGGWDEVSYICDNISYYFTLKASTWVLKRLRAFYRILPNLLNSFLRFSIKQFAKMHLLKKLHGWAWCRSQDRMRWKLFASKSFVLFVHKSIRSITIVMVRGVLYRIECRDVVGKLKSNNFTDIWLEWKANIW